MIQPYIDTDIEQLLSTFKEGAGVIDFKLYSVGTALTSPYQKHLEVAKQTLIEVAKEINSYLDRVAVKNKRRREDFFTMDYDFTLLKSSGKEITVSEFIGNAVTLEKHKERLQRLPESAIYYNYCKPYKERTMGSGFTYAFFESPYGISIKRKREAERDNYTNGKFFFEFCYALFTDLSQIEVYEWSTDCSNYFDIGKDWWGTFFYTVYNPLRDCYIGIVASESD
jgi:hypothetical protein